MTSAFELNGHIRKHLFQKALYLSLCKRVPSYRKGCAFMTERATVQHYINTWKRPQLTLNRCSAPGPAYARAKLLREGVVTSLLNTVGDDPLVVQTLFTVCACPPHTEARWWIAHQRHAKSLLMLTMMQIIGTEWVQHMHS